MFYIKEIIRLFRQNVTPQTILNCFVKAGFKDSDNYVLIDNTNIANSEWNFFTSHLNLNNKIFFKNLKNHLQTSYTSSR